MKRHLVVIMGLAVLAASPLVLLQPRAQAQNVPGTIWNCSVDGVGATLTACTFSATAPTPPSGSRMFITDIVSQSTTSTGGAFILRVGTSLQTGGSANCASSTTTVFPGAAGSTARIVSAANTAAPTVINLTRPIALPLNSDLCLLGVATNTTSAQITGYWQ